MWPSFLEKRKYGEQEAILCKCATILVKTDEVPICMGHPFLYSVMDKRNVNRYVNNNRDSD